MQVAINLRCPYLCVFSLKSNEGQRSVSVGVLVGEKGKESKIMSWTREKIFPLVTLLDMAVV